MYPSKEDYTNITTMPPHINIRKLKGEPDNEWLAYIEELCDAYRIGDNSLINSLRKQRSNKSHILRNERRAQERKRVQQNNQNEDPPPSSPQSQPSTGGLKSSSRGALKSIVDPSFSQKYPGVMEAAFKVLDYLYLHPSHAPSVKGAGLLLAAESCYGNPPIMNVLRRHYLRQSFSKTDLSAIPADDNTRECFVYGVGYGSSTFGTVAE